MADVEAKKVKRTRKPKPILEEPTVKIPDEIPLLPIRDAVYFPHMIFPLFAGREKSVRALDEAMAQAEKLQLPVLVQYGKKDQVIPKEPMLKVLGTMPSTTRKAFYDQGYHMLLRDLYREKPLIDIATWITDHNNPLPYGTRSW